PSDQDEAGGTFEVTATGSSSGLTASATFTDSSTFNLDQLQNGTPTTAPEWANGEINSNNSTYLEGRSVPFRFFFGGVEGNESHHFTIVAAWTKSGEHGYDYFTSFDRTESAVITAVGGPCSTTSTSPPADCATPTAVGTFPDPRNPANWDFTSVGGSAPADFFPASFLLDGLPLTLKAYHVASATFGKYFFSGSSTDRDINIRLDFVTSSGLSANSSAGFFWGGHLAVGSDTSHWGVGHGSGSVSGGSYHMSTAQPDDQGQGKD